MPPLPAGDTGIRVIGFEAWLPQDAGQTFVPDYLKEIADSAALVSWRVNTSTGEVFFTEQGAALIAPSAARLIVSPADRTVNTDSDYLLELTMKKNEAAIEVLRVQIPAGYLIGAQSLPAGKVVGTLEGYLRRGQPLGHRPNNHLFWYAGDDRHHQPVGAEGGLRGGRERQRFSCQQDQLLYLG